MADVLVVYDDMQYTRRDWRNRNLVKTDRGLQWLTIPVEVKGKFEQRIRDVVISDPKWQRSHLGVLKQAYAKAPYFDWLYPLLERTYAELTNASLTEVNVALLRWLCSLLGIRTTFQYSWEYELHEERTQRLVNICRDLKATKYLSGPAAKTYMEEALFTEAGIQVSYMDYSGYPEYEQFYPPFEHGVSILDLLFHTGPQALQYMKYAEHRHYGI
jgi:hypothetical protein